MDEHRQAKARKIACRKIDALLKQAAKIRDAVWTLAEFVEDETDASDTLANLMSAADHANQLVLSLLLDASSQAENSLPEFDQTPGSGADVRLAP